MSGKVEHLGGDRWRVRLYMGSDPVTGRKVQRSRTFRANGPRAAERAAVKHKASLETERDTIALYAGSLADLIDRYLALMVGRHEWSPSTERRNVQVCAVIRADLGSHRLDALNAQHVDQWYTDLLGRGLKPLTVRQYAVMLGAVLAQGDLWDMCTDRATKKASPPRVPKSRVTPPTDGVVQLLLNSATGRLRAACAVAAIAGLRRGEIVALRWSDFDGRVLTVTRTVLDMPGGAVHVKPPKSQLPRVFTVDRLLLAEMEPLHDHALDAFARLGVDTPADWYVFADLRRDPTGQTPMRPMWLSQAWDRHRVAHGAASVKLHHLRHWHLSTLSASGVPMTTVQARGGHADLETAGIYNHALPAGDEMADGVIERALGRA